MKLPKSNSSSSKDEKFNPFPDIKPKEEKKAKSQQTLFSVALLIFILSLSIYIVLSRSNDSLVSDSTTPTTNQQVSAAPTPTPKVLPTGKQVYNYSHGKDVVGPKLTKVTLDPMDPKQGENITITANISHDSDVTLAQVNIITDNSSLPLDLKLISGSQKNGTWEVKTKMKDTYNYNYYIKFDLRSSTGNYDGGLKLR